MTDALPLLAVYALVFIAAHAGGRWIERRAARRRAMRQVTQMLRTADAVRSICDAVHQRRSADLRLDMIRVPGDTDAEIVDALIGDGHHHRRSEA